MPGTGEGSAPWLESGNLGRVANVLSADLLRLEPPQDKAITGNMAALKLRLLLQKADATWRSPRRKISRPASADPNEWTPERAAKLVDWLKANEMAVVLRNAEPEPALAAALEDRELALLSTAAQNRPISSSLWSATSRR